MLRRLPNVFCLHCGRSVPRAALRCLWCHTPSPLRPWPRTAPSRARRTTPPALRASEAPAARGAGQA